MLSWPEIALVVALIICSCGLLYLVKKWPGKRTMTLSQHAAQTRESQLFFAALLVSMTGFFSWFLVLWLRNEAQFPIGFSVISILISIGVFVAGVVPETTGWRVTVHRLAAFGFATLMVPLVAIMALYNDGPTAVRLLLGLISLYLANDVRLLAQNKGEHPNMLHRQSIYLGLFGLAIILITFFGEY